MLTGAGFRPPSVNAIVLGASAGAIDALMALLPPLPAEAKVPVIAVVHVPPSGPSALVEVFSRRCALAVREPRDKEPISPGIWFAPPDYHLLVESDRTFALSADDPVHCSRPSIDVLFESAAYAYGPALAAVVLTGASSDGAAGASSIRVAGGFVVVQDPATAEYPLMPVSAIERSQPHRVAALSEIAELMRGLAVRHEEASPG